MGNFRKTTNNIDPVLRRRRHQTPTTSGLNAPYIDFVSQLTVFGEDNDNVVLVGEK